LYYQKLSDRWAVESQVGGWVPIDGSTFTFVNSKTSPAFGHSYAGDIFFYGFGPSYQLYRSDRVSFAPVVELFGWNVRGGLATIASGTSFAQQDATGTNIVNIKFGARTLVGRHSSFYVGYGRALTSSVWYSDIVRVEYRYVF
jgi:hypothetical protein